MHRKVYIVIVNYNGYYDTIECLESLLNIDYSNYQIILVDNSSTDNSIEKIEEWCNGKRSAIETSFPYLVEPITKKPLDYVKLRENNFLNSVFSHKLIIVESNENNGFAAGNNIAINYMLKNNINSYCWMLNNDTVVKKDTLLKLVECQKVNDLGLTGSVLKYYNNPNKIQSLGGSVNSFFGTTNHITDSNITSIDYVVGASCLVSPDVLFSLGILKEDYFLYYEDVDYSYRAQQKGFSIGFAKDSIVYHKLGKSTGANIFAKEREDDVDILILKNRIKFYRRFINGFFGLYIGFFIVIILRLLRGKFKVIKPIIKLLINNEK